MNWIKLSYLIAIIFYCTYSSVAQDTLIVQGTISTTTAASVNNLPVSIYAIDSSGVVDTAFTQTDTNGFYRDTIIRSNYQKIRVEIPKCTSSSSQISKVRNIILVSGGVVLETVNFTNYCYEVSFTYFNKSDSVSFASARQGGVSPHTYYWDFGDLSPINNGTNPIHFYTGGPNFLINLCVVDNNSDTTCASDSINIDDCQAFFTHVDSGSGTVAFFDASISPNTPQYLWDFGDATTGTTANPVHLYPGFGYYRAVLTITDSASFCSDSYADSVLVDSSQCTASFTFQQRLNIVKFENTSTGSSTPAFRYQWTFGDGSPLNQEESPVYIYGTNGFYPVTLVIEDTLTSCTDMTSLNVAINSAGPNNLILAGEVQLNYPGNYASIELFGNNSGNNIILDTMSTFFGHYSFQVDSNQVYYVKANPEKDHPDSSRITPVYFENGMIWNNATAIVISSENSLDNDIMLDMTALQSGSYSISGKVLRQVSSLPSEPIPGVDILLFSGSNNFLLRSKTGSDGSYLLDGLSDGTYKVYVDVADKITYPTQVELNSSNTKAENIDFTIYDDVILSQGKDISWLEESKMEVFPNPFEDFIVLRKNTHRDRLLRVRLFQEDGRLILEKEILFTGENKIEFNNLPENQYIMTVEDEGNMEVFQIQKN